MKNDDYFGQQQQQQQVWLTLTVRAVDLVRSIFEQFRSRSHTYVNQLLHLRKLKIQSITMFLGAIPALNLIQIHFRNHMAVCIEIIEYFHS